MVGRTVGFYQGGRGPIPFLDACSDLSKSAKSLALIPIEKPDWFTNTLPGSGQDDWYIVQEDNVNIWVRASASSQHIGVFAIGHKDCLPWQDVSAEQKLSDKTTKKLNAWWQAWLTERGWPTVD